MTLWQKLLGRKASEKLMAKAATAVNITLADHAASKGTTIHDGLCSACMGWMKWPEVMPVYPLPTRVQPTEPKQAQLDLGGWCPKCDRILCPNELQWMAAQIRDQTWWMAGCRACLMPVAGKKRRTDTHASR